MPLVRRSCPHCGTPIGAKRTYLLNFWGIRWECQGCSRLLKFSTRRKVLISVLNLPLMAAFSYALVTHDTRMALAAVAVHLVVGSLDTVELVGGAQ